jgi:hypothetical protein
VGDLQGTYHTAVFDLDGDLDQDLILGRCAGVSVWTNTQNPCPLLKYGTANPNSTGQVAKVSSYGCGSLGNEKLIFNVTNLPANATGRMIFSKGKMVPCGPYGDGKICLTRRSLDQTSLPLVQADALGHARVVMDFAAEPFASAQPGQKRYFQFKYDDPAGGPAGFNLSEAMEVSICQ